MGPWGFMLRLSLPTKGARLNTGSTGSFEAVARHTGELERYDIREVSYRSRPLVAYEDAENATTTFLWSGRNHELSWTAGGREVPFSAFTSLLSVVNLNDSPSGLVVTAKPGTGASVSMSLAANTLTGLCAITVQPIRDQSVQVPEHAGRRVSGGIMWRTDESGADGTLRRTAAIAGSSTLTYLGFFEPNAPANAELSQYLRVTLS
jgi:hypothetical protein